MDEQRAGQQNKMEKVTGHYYIEDLYGYPEYQWLCTEDYIEGEMG